MYLGQNPLADSQLRDGLEPHSVVQAHVHHSGGMKPNMGSHVLSATELTRLHTLHGTGVGNSYSILEIYIITIDQEMSPT